MRRFRQLRSSRSMARPSSSSRQPIPLRTRVIIGWAAALVLVVGIAFAIGRIGGPEVPPVGSSAAASAAETPLPIAFGTLRDEDSGAVAPTAAIDRFTIGDRFVYSIGRPDATGSTILYVEVIRAGGDSAAVQTPAPLPYNPPGASVFAYDVPAEALLTDFGAGRFVMRIYTDPAGSPIAEGTFELVEDRSTGG